MIKATHIKSLGFTLIELLVVVAVLGVLAAGILIAIDPLEQINRGTDAGMKQSVANLGRALQAYGTSHNATIFTPGAGDWLTLLQNSGEIKIIPTAPLAPAACAAAAGTKSLQGNFCLATNAGHTEAIVYTTPVSKSVKANCPGAVIATPTERAWYIYSTFDGRAGVVCTGVAAEPAVASHAVGQPEPFVAN